MLKGIPQIITPEFIYALSAMGHGDSIVLADANFPAHRLANKNLVHLQGISIPTLLDAVLKLFPTDDLHDKSGYVMAVAEADLKKGVTTPIWNIYKDIFAKHKLAPYLGEIERYAFYEEASRSELIVLTGENTPYANIMLYKGCILDS